MEQETVEAPIDTGAEETQERVRFTPEQQQRVDQIVRESMGRAAKDLRNEVAASKARSLELEAQLVGAQAQLAQLREQHEHTETALEEIHQQHKATQAEVERYRKLASDREQELVQTNKRIAIRDAAARCNFVDPGKAEKLTADCIKSDGIGGFFVADDTGKPKLNAGLQRMTLDEFYTGYAAANPWMVKSDIRQGTGATEAKHSTLSETTEYPVELVFGKSSDSALANRLALKNKPLYMRLRKIARERGLV